MKMARLAENIVLTVNFFTVYILSQRGVSHKENGNLSVYTVPVSTTSFVRMVYSSYSMRKTGTFETSVKFC